MDSMYNAFGKFEIYVSEDDKQQAIDLLENHENTPAAWLTPTSGPSRNGAISIDGSCFDIAAALAAPR